MLRPIAFFFALLAAGDITAEIISLIDPRNIVCITEENSIVFLDPPQVQNDTSNSILLQNDWEKTDSTTYPFESITDKRWEEFQVIYDSTIRRSFRRSLTLSVYVEKNSNMVPEFFFEDDESSDEYISKISNISRSQWIHYHVKHDGKDLFFFENHMQVMSVTNFSPTDVIGRTKNSTYWKIHNYELESNKAASETPTRLSNFNESCLMLYVSTCQYCYIEVSTSGKENYKLRSSNGKHTFNWNYQQLIFDNGENNYVDIYRRTEDSRDGFWGVDIRRCPKKTSSGNLIYERSFEKELKEKTFCRILDDKNITNQNYEPLHYKFGKLGKNRIPCEEITGNHSCEKKKICHGQNCKCAWGYSGEDCQEVCEDGKWGMACRYNCTECTLCNRFTGSCTRNEDVFSTPTRQPNVINVETSIWVVVSLLVVLLVVSCSRLRLPWCKEDHHRYEPEKINGSEKKLLQL